MDAAAYIVFTAAGLAVGSPLRGRSRTVVVTWRLLVCFLAGSRRASSRQSGAMPMEALGSYW